LLFYALTQGAQFLSLLYLPAVATSLLLSCTTILVGLLGVVLLEESPAAVQWGATVLYLGGVLLYFFPLRFAFRTTIGIVAALVGVLANALSSILGRHLNRTLRTLSAMQSSIINNTMLFQIALLAWIFLDEKLTWRQVVGMAIAAVAVAVVQVRRRPLKQPG
jgi:drug/metabolite transporter (DMT)-like permease